MRNKGFNERLNKQEFAGTTSLKDCANQAAEYNQVQDLQFRLDKANAVIEEQKTEMLELYRRIHGQDRPEY